MMKVIVISHVRFNGRDTNVCAAAVINDDLDPKTIKQLKTKAKALDYNLHVRVADSIEDLEGWLDCELAADD